MSDRLRLLLEQLERKYPDRMFVGVPEVAKIFGCSEGTIYNRTHRKAKRKFPVQPARAPGKKFLLADIAIVLAAEQEN